MPEQCQQDDDWQWNAQQPQQRASSKTHESLLSDWNRNQYRRRKFQRSRCVGGWRGAREWNQLSNFYTQQVGFYCRNVASSGNHLAHLNLPLDRR